MRHLLNGLSCMAEPRAIKLTLNPQGVINPVLRAFHDAVEVVTISVEAIDNADLSQPIVAKGRVHLTLTDPNPKPDAERRAEYRNWLVAKGFQEYARGVRATLEEAYFYNALIVRARDSNPGTTNDWDAFQVEMNKIRTKGGNLGFPALMREVSKNLTSPLNFENEFLSLQKVRNCIEHRQGMVGLEDVDEKTNTLKLSFPRLKITTESEGKETEIGIGSFVEKDSVLKIQFASELREFKLAEKVIITAQDFADIGWGCWAFADELGKKLPKLEAAVTL